MPVWQATDCSSPFVDTLNVSTRLQLTYTLQLEQKVINSDVAVSLRILCHL